MSSSDDKQVDLSGTVQAFKTRVSELLTIPITEIRESPAAHVYCVLDRVLT